jgi:hypothetical protein
MGFQLIGLDRIGLDGTQCRGTPSDLIAPFTRFQPDRIEVRNLNSLIRIEEDVARLQITVQQPEAVRKPKTKRNSCNRFRFRSQRPPRRRS